MDLWQCRLVDGSQPRSAATEAHDMTMTTAGLSDSFAARPKVPLLLCILPGAACVALGLAGGDASALRAERARCLAVRPLLDTLFAQANF